jgi:protein TonB
MMTQQTIQAPEFGIGRRREARIALGRRRVLWIAALLSVGIHFFAAGAVILLPRILPQETRPQEQGTVELMMVEEKGSQPSQAGEKPDVKSTPPESQAAPKTEPVKEESPAPESKANLAQTVAHGDEPAQSDIATPTPTKTDTGPATKLAAAQPIPPDPQKAPVFDLAGTESDTNAIVLGGNVLPAMKDDRFRNRNPDYPIEAQINNQHGSIRVIVHVAANGLVSGVDVLESSGVSLLDRAAVDAVRKWRFHPAMHEGRTIPFDMPFTFIFSE